MGPVTQQLCALWTFEWELPAPTCVLTAAAAWLRESWITAPDTDWVLTTGLAEAARNDLPDPAASTIASQINLKNVFGVNHVCICWDVL